MLLYWNSTCFSLLYLFLLLCICSWELHAFSLPGFIFLFLVKSVHTNAQLTFVISHRPFGTNIITNCEWFCLKPIFLTQKVWQGNLWHVESHTGISQCLESNGGPKGFIWDRNEKRQQKDEEKREILFANQ